MPILCQLPGEDFLLWRLASFPQPHLRIASALRGLASIASRAQCRISSSSATTRGGFLCCTVLCCRTCSLHRHIHLIRFGLEVDSIQNPEALLRCALAPSSNLQHNGDGCTDAERHLLHPMLPSMWLVLARRSGLHAGAGADGDY